MLFAAPVLAQSPAPPPETGSITGHVWLGDSHLPARMATVMLVEVPRDNSGKAESDLDAAMAQTGMDGSFAIPRVAPGSYFIFPEKSGYIIPAPAGLTGKGEQPASKELKDLLAAGLSPITVAANRVTAAELVLHRGAAISGVIRFDDGAPDSGVAVSLLRKDKSGKWAALATADDDMGRTATDDLGNFRVSGLPAGEYLLKTTLELQGSMSKAGNDVSGGETYRWDVYFGDGVRPQDAKSITLKDSEESNGDNITIPLSRLHSVSGTVISLESGAPVTSAHVELHNTEDDALDCETRIEWDTGRFRLPFVAEGEYTLKVTHGQDATPGPQGDQKPLRTYADSAQPLIVKGETSVTIQLKTQAPERQQQF